VDVAERKRIGSRVRQARLETGLTQAELAEQLGITTRSVQNYESGAIVPWRHLSRIEVLTRKRSGWLLRGEDGGELQVVLADLQRVMEQHQQLLQTHISALQRNTERLREQREARRQRTGQPTESA
jgi:transcriptional regulator with XRE-family HTH domain